MRIIRRFYEDEKGQVLPLFALLIVVLMGFTALAFDIGFTYYSKSELQLAADAAALAASLDIPPIPTLGLEEDEAEDIEEKIIATGEQFSQIQKISPDTIVVTPDLTQRKVTVELTKTVEHFFAKVLNIDSSPIKARAVAKRYAVWNGNVLPVVNMNEDYNVGETILFQEQWDESSSDRDWLLIKSYMDAQGITDIEDMTVDPSEGLIVDNGELGTYMHDLETLLSYGGPYYIYSLSKDAFENIEGGHGLAVIDLLGNPQTRFIDKVGFSNKDVIAPYAKLNAEGKAIPCTIADKDNPTFIEQIVILELGTAAISGPGGGTKQDISGGVIGVHSITKEFDPMETEIGITKSRLVE